MHLNAAFGAEVVIAAVVGRLKRCAFVIDFGFEREDLKATRVGQYVTMPVGEAVNVTFRIESLTRKLQVPVLAGDSFLKDWPEGHQFYQNVGIHPVKGQPDPVEVYSLIEVPTMAI